MAKATGQFTYRITRNNPEKIIKKGRITATSMRDAVNKIEQIESDNLPPDTAFKSWNYFDAWSGQRSGTDSDGYRYTTTLMLIE